MHRSVVLLSAGLDSTVNLFESRLVSEVALALTFDYGQRAAEREIEAAAALSKHLNIEHRVLRLPFFSEFTKTALLNSTAQIPTANEVKIDDHSISECTAKAVWIPNRNGIFLNIAAGFAEGLGANWIVPGFNIEEAATFPDNSEEFLEAATLALSYSTGQDANKQVKVKCFTTQMDKTQIYARALQLDVPVDLVWPCYFGEKEPCGKCESCLRFRRAQNKNNLRAK